jgi:hypothetical protein
MHLVVTLEYGKIKGFRWEQGLKGCAHMEDGNAQYSFKQTFQDFVTGKEKTIDSKYCSIPYCKAGNEKACNMKIFVSWEGTDENLHYMVSASSRLENFDRWGIQKMYESMLAYESELAFTSDSVVKDVTDCVNNF